MSILNLQMNDFFTLNIYISGDKISYGLKYEAHGGLIKMYYYTRLLWCSCFCNAIFQIWMFVAILFV